MKDYFPDKWRQILRLNHLDTCRGGWSGLSRCELELPEGGKTAVFLRHQENHITPGLQRLNQDAKKLWRSIARRTEVKGRVQLQSPQIDDKSHADD